MTKCILMEKNLRSKVDVLLLVGQKILSEMKEKTFLFFMMRILTRQCQDFCVNTGFFFLDAIYLAIEIYGKSSQTI